MGVPIDRNYRMISRHRASFARALPRVGAPLECDDLQRIPATAGEVLSPAWPAVPWMMRYNASCFGQRRPPRRIAVDLPRDRAERKQALVRELESAATPARHPRLRTRMP